MYLIQWNTLSPPSALIRPLRSNPHHTSCSVQLVVKYGERSEMASGKNEMGWIKHGPWQYVIDRDGKHVQRWLLFLIQ